MPDVPVQQASQCKSCRLRTQRYFCNLPPEALTELDRIKEIRTFAPRTVLFAEGKSLDEVMIVCEGRAALLVSSSTGNPLMLGLSERGEVLGLSSAVSGRPHEVSAEALDTLQVAAIPRRLFLTFLERFPAASANAARELGHKVNRAYDRLRLTAPGLSVRQKLAAWLLHMQQLRSDSGELLPIALTHERIAQLLGVSRESVTRALSDLKRRGVLEVRGIHFHIRNSAYLSKLLHAGR
jgi:CRP/FNR family transcriptional regulator, cyclic AMP receptor protein